MKKFYGYLKSTNQQPMTQLQTDQEEFLQLTTQLIKYNQNNHSNMNVDQIIDVIKQLTHYAIKGDSELHKQLFELFMEKDILLRVYSILQKPSSPPNLIQAIFESVCSLLLNIREVTNRNYLLSHMSISNMVLWKTPFELTKPNIELVETYISFLNLLAVKLDDMSSMFFLNIKYPQFPLIWNAIRFFNHPELMVRNKSRSIVLHILNIKNPNIQAYANSFPFIYYYFNLGNQLIATMRQTSILVEQIKWDFNLQQFQQLQAISEELSEQLQYISDLISNNEQISQLILDFVLQRPIIFVSQVIKYGYQNLDIAIAIQMCYLFIKYYTGKGKILQYIYTVFQMDDRQKIAIVDQPWEYFNPLDLDQNFMIKQSRIVFDTLQSIDIMELKHENIDIRLCLQNLRQIDCVVSQDMNQKELDQQSLNCLNRIYSHITNKDVIIYVLLIMRHLKNSLYQQDVCKFIKVYQILQLFQNNDSQLIVKLLLTDILIGAEDKYLKQIVVEVYNEMINQIVKIISQFQLFMDQLVDIFKKKMINITQEFLITDHINIKDPQHTLIFDPYSSLPNILKLQYNIILSQHPIFQEYPKIYEQLPELTKLKSDQYKIDDKVDCKMIACQFSDTGHFYDMEKYYILQIDNFLHVVKIDENNIITDVLCSKLWQLLQVYGIERVQVLQFCYFDNSKFYIKLQNFDDVNLVNSIASQQQQQFSDWYKELLITKLKSLMIINQELY